MQRLLASLTLVLVLGMVITRVLLMRRSGIRAMHFGNIDKKDFLIPPFAFFYFYIVFAAAFGWPMVSKQQFFDSEALAWVGVFLCAVGLLLFLLSLVSFGRSFRVGIYTDHPDKLITTGVLRSLAIPSMWRFGPSCWASSWYSPTGSCWPISAPPPGCSTVKCCAKEPT